LRRNTRHAENHDHVAASHDKFSAAAISCLRASIDRQMIEKDLLE
jgi:hypothetical protein